MWMFTPLGFFSATLTNPSYKELPKHQQHGHIMVRARVREDLERLLVLHKESALQPEDPAILDLPGHDYPYRIIVTKQSWVTLAAILAGRIDYSNFKSAVTKAAPGGEGLARHDLYMKVWSVMHGAEGWLRKRVKSIKEGRKAAKGQGGFSFWTRPQSRHSDPRSDDDMRAIYGNRGWQEWLMEDEEHAVVTDLPEGTHGVIDADSVIDNPTNDDIAAFEAALARPSRRRRRGR